MIKCAETQFVRWIIKRDLPYLLWHEYNIFANPWSEAKFIAYLRRRDCLGLVVESYVNSAKHASSEHGVPVGYLICEVAATSFHVLNFAVYQDARQTGVGSLLLGRLIERLHPTRKKSIKIMVCENNVATQLFLARRGFRYEATLPGDHSPSGVDEYLFVYRLAELETDEADRYDREMSAEWVQLIEHSDRGLSTAKESRFQCCCL